MHTFMLILIGGSACVIIYLLCQVIKMTYQGYRIRNDPEAKKEEMKRRGMYSLEDLNRDVALKHCYSAIWVDLRKRKPEPPLEMEAYYKLQAGLTDEFANIVLYNRQTKRENI